MCVLFELPPGACVRGRARDPSWPAQHRCSVLGRGVVALAPGGENCCAVAQLAGQCGGGARSAPCSVACSAAASGGRPRPGQRDAPPRATAPAPGQRGGGGGGVALRRVWDPVHHLCSPPPLPSLPRPALRLMQPGENLRGARSQHCASASLSLVPAFYRPVLLLGSAATRGLRLGPTPGRAGEARCGTRPRNAARGSAAPPGHGTSQGQASAHTAVPPPPRGLGLLSGVRLRWMPRCQRAGGAGCASPVGAPALRGARQLK